MYGPIHACCSCIETPYGRLDCCLPGNMLHCIYSSRSFQVGGNTAVSIPLREGSSHNRRASTPRAALAPKHNTHIHTYLFTGWRLSTYLCEHAGLDGEGAIVKPAAAIAPHPQLDAERDVLSLRAGGVQPCQSRSRHCGQQPSLSLAVLYQAFPVGNAVPGCVRAADQAWPGARRDDTPRDCHFCPPTHLLVRTEPLRLRHRLARATAVCAGGNYC